MDPAIASRIRLLVLDVDGVLTDNAIFIGSVDGKRVEFKRFDIQDGLGIRLLAHTDVQIAWITGRLSEATAMRAAELGIDLLRQVPATAKVPALEEIRAELGLAWDEIAFVGDDLADYLVMQKVGLPVAVANARPEVKRIARYVTTASGGHGAVREVIDALLKARGEFDMALARYCGTVETAS